MNTEKEVIRLYLNACKTYGWTPDKKGLRAFFQQIVVGRRDEKGRLIWPDNKKENAMEILQEGIVHIRAESYRVLVEERLLHRMKAEKLEELVKELQKERDNLKELLDAAEHELEKAKDTLREQEESARYWYEKYQLLNAGNTTAEGPEKQQDTQDHPEI